MLLSFKHGYPVSFDERQVNDVIIYDLKFGARETKDVVRDIKSDDYFHLVVTRNNDSKYAAVYLNGDLINSYTDNSDVLMYEGINKEIALFRYKTFSEDTKDGDIAFLKLYNYDLSKDDVMSKYLELVDIYPDGSAPTPSSDVLTYDFTNGLNEKQQKSSPLVPSGSEPGEIESVTSSNGQIKPVYSYAVNGGLVYDDTEKLFLNHGSYTIETFFYYSDASQLVSASTNPIISFNSKSVPFGGKFGFPYNLQIYSYRIYTYNFGTPDGGKILSIDSIQSNQYIHAVISRDEATKMVKIYYNGILRDSFTDPGGYNTFYSKDRQINFFNTNRWWQAPGHVAKILIHNQALNDEDIASSYNRLMNEYTPVQKVKSAIEEKIIYTISATKLTLQDEIVTKYAAYCIYDLKAGLLLKNSLLGNNTIDIQALPKGMYLLQLNDNSGNKQTVKFIKP